jgi:hypothetical protein
MREPRNITHKEMRGIEQEALMDSFRILFQLLSTVTEGIYTVTVRKCKFSYPSLLLEFISHYGKANVG